MSLRVRSAVTIVDDGDQSSITVEERDDPSERERWWIYPSGGGTSVYVSSADLLEFASALRALAERDPFEASA